MTYQFFKCHNFKGALYIRPPSEKKEKGRGVTFLFKNREYAIFQAKTTCSINNESKFSTAVTFGQENPSTA